MGAPWSFSQDEWTRPEAVKGKSMAWPDPVVGHSVFCLSRTDVFWGNASSNHVGLLTMKPFRGKWRGPHWAGHCWPFFWAHWWSLGRHKAPATSINVFLPIFFKPKLEKDIPFSIRQKAARICTRGSYVFAPSGSWSERWCPQAEMQRQEKARDPWSPESRGRICSKAYLFSCRSVSRCSVPS